MQKRLPVVCPGCSSALSVKSLICEECSTEVTGQFAIPALLRLAPEDLEFVLAFVKSSGSLKLMAQKLGYSYPTVRNMLDDIIQKLENNQKQ